MIKRILKCSFILGICLSSSLVANDNINYNKAGFNMDVLDSKKNMLIEHEKIVFNENIEYVPAETYEEKEKYERVEKVNNEK